jgi:hypothetical protein
MPPKDNKTAKPRTKKSNEVDELRQRLSEAKEHRNLLIQALHGFAGNTRRVALDRNNSDTVLAWLIEEIGQLTATRPILGRSTLTALKVPIPRLTKLINSTWFPDGGGFGNIVGTTTVGNLAYAIAHKE